MSVSSHETAWFLKKCIHNIKVLVKIVRKDTHFTRRPAYVRDISPFTREVHEMEVYSLNTKWRYRDEISVSGNWGKNATTINILYIFFAFLLDHTYVM